jgi:uncharacterized protein Yka (UPF0111/DUF47 family)
MFSLQKFFGKDPKFFDLLNSAAAEANLGVKELPKLKNKETFEQGFFAIKHHRKISHEIFQETSEMIVKTFVTSLEKEDLEALAVCLYRILKPLDKFVERLQIAPELTNSIDFSMHYELLNEASNTVSELVKLISSSSCLETAKKLNDQLRRIESEADNLQQRLLKELFTNHKNNPLTVILVKDLYDLLEKSVDKCRDTGSVVMHIILKNS